MLPDILRSRDNQTLKFGQLIEYNMRNICLENYAQNLVENILRFFDGLPNFPFNTSETKPDYW